MSKRFHLYSYLIVAGIFFGLSIDFRTIGRWREETASFIYTKAVISREFEGDI